MFTIGKTTLLNILNFRNRGKLKITGDVKINGSIITSAAELSSISGYVQQEDLFLGYLKVKEQLRFQSYMRMDRSATDNEREERVEEIMSELNLKKCENTVIGIPEKDVKGISGGERRRLAFGCELITDPNLMFLDEPTSGLDSFMAMSIVECIRNLASKGKTIICTIHQPSSDIFEKFDKLCLMAEGRLAYIGDLEGAAKFFTDQSFPIPVNYNPADHYINTLAVGPSDIESSKIKIDSICDNFQSSDLYKNLEEDLKIANYMEKDPNLKLNLTTKISYKAGFFAQLKWLLWRTFLSTIRDPMATQIAIFQTIVIAILLGLIYLQLKYDQTGIQNINGVLFFLITITSFSNLFAVINSFTAEIPIFLREHQNGMYMVITYYLSKITVDLPKFVILPFVLTSIIYWMANLNNDVGRFFICCGIIILVANTSVAFGSFLSAAAPSANAALGLSGPVLVPLMIFSGFFLNNSSTPDYFLWLKYISWFSYANELLAINQWDGVTNITCSANLPAQCITEGSQILKQLDYKKDNYVIDFIAISAILFGYRVLTFLILLFKSYRK